MGGLSNGTLLFNNECLCVSKGRHAHRLILRTCTRTFELRSVDMHNFTRRGVTSATVFIYLWPPDLTEIVGDTT